MNDNKRAVFTFSFFWPFIFTIVFIFLKVFKCIDWSWWIVFCPIWVPALVLTTFTVLLYLVKLIIYIIEIKKRY